jgi:hypothetical protein
MGLSQHTSHSPRNVSPGSHQQCATPTNRRGQVSRRRLTLHKHIFHQTETTMYFPHQNVLVTRTQIKTLYKQQTPHLQNILKPIWAYGMQLWGTASTSNMEILERFQSKALRMITYAPSYVPNTVIRKNFQIPTVKHEIRRYSYHYSKRLSVHPNKIILNLQEPPETRRLRKNLPIDLPTRFNM